MRTIDHVSAPQPRIIPVTGASDRLVRAACHQAKIDPQYLQEMFEQTGLLAGTAIKPACRRQSHLNEGGAPVQTCLSYQSQSDRSEVRFLIDPFFDEDPQSRHNRSLSFAAQLADALGQKHVFSRLTRTCLAADAGTLWLAGRLKPGGTPFGDGMAVYLNAETFGSQSIHTLLSNALPKNPDRTRFLDGWLPVSRLVSLAMEFGRAPHPTRMKLYLRLNAKSPPKLLRELAGTGAQAGADILQPQSPWPASGLTIGISFDATTGAPDGIKVDYCLCAACRDAARLQGPPEEKLAQSVPATRPMLAAGNLALLGFALGGKGRRINAYFEPTT